VKQLDRYIAHNMIGMILLALVVLGGLDTVFNFIAELEDIKNQYTVLDAAFYEICTFPRRILQFLPVGTLIGCLMGLGVLAGNSELVAMRAHGVSIMRIVWSEIKPVIGVALVGIFIMQFIAPYTEQVGQSYRSLQKGGGQFLKIKSGNWHRDGDDFIHINAVEPSGMIHGITRYTFNQQQQLIATSFARKAKFEQDYWVVYDKKITYLSEQKMESQFIEVSHWYTKLNPEVITLLIMNPDFLSFTDLYHYVGYLKAQNQDYLRFLLALCKKCMQPFATIVMVLLAVSFIFGPLRYASTGLRMMTGLMCGMVFFYAQDFFSQASIVYRFSPIISSIMPTILFGGVGLIMVLRAR